MSEIKSRREAGKKRSQREFEKLAENRGKRNRAVVGREGWVTFLEDRNDLSGSPKGRNIGPLPTKSEQERQERSENGRERFEHLSTNVVLTRGFAGRELANVQADKRDVIRGRSGESGRL